MRTKSIHLFVAALSVFCLFSAVAVAADRSDVPDSEKWNLAELYPDTDAFLMAKGDIEGLVCELEAFKGRLGSSASTLLDCFEKSTAMNLKLSRLFSFAAMNSDLDVSDSKAMELRQSLGPMAADLGARMAWFSPEILTIPEKKLEKFYVEEPKLMTYKPGIDEILRLKKHTLSPEEEKIMADAGLVTGTARDAYGIFSNADIPRATVTLSDGKEVRLDAAAYTFYRAVPDRGDRQKVFKAFFGNLMEYKGLFGTLMNGEVKKNYFRTKARHYDSCLASALAGPNVPVEVYHNLIRNVHKNLPTLWRYLKLRQRIMGLDTLRYSDLYASIVKEVDISYDIAKAKKMVASAVSPLGNEYVKVLGDGMNNRWVDWHPTAGKRSGAYSNGSVSEVHPFILMNFNGTYEDVSTLAHECGHAMHSYYSNKDQHPSNSGYTIFVAEVASTCNEHLLIDYILKNTDDDAVRLFLLGSYIDGIRQTLFRQTQFAEFELKIHEMVEQGMALTGDNLTEVYKQILETYYGVAEGVTEIDPVCFAEWSYIPHFYRNFYVYSYSTSITASTAISQMIIEGREGAVENYRKFLGLGGSIPPVDELKIAGVDMTTDEPFDITMKAMNKALDEMEAIVDRM